MSQRESPTTDRPHRPFESAPDVVSRRLLGLAAPIASRVGPAAVSLRQLLEALHAGGPPTLPTHDRTATDEIEQALHTPDVFLIQGSAGTGKSHAVTRILREASARGWRVLFLAATPAALDRALTPALDTADFAAVRCLAEGETLDRLPPCVRKTTLPERLRAFTEQTTGAVTAELRHLDEAAISTQQHGTALDELTLLLSREQEVAGTLDQARARLDRLPKTIDGDTGPDELADLWGRLRETRGEVARQQAELQRQLNQCREQEQTRQGELDRLRPLVEATQANRWWSPNYWRARGKGDVENQAATLELACQELRASTLKNQQSADQLLARLEEQSRATTLALAHLRAEAEAKVNLHLSEQTAVHERWQAVGSTLPADLRPTEPTLAAVAECRQRRSELLTQIVQHRAAAEERRLALDQANVDLPQRLAEAIPIVAATIDSFCADPILGADTTPGRFDLLVLEEAERVTEADLLSVADLARRWVLIGEPTRVQEQQPRRGNRPRLPHLRPGFFQRLWNRLHDDPSARQVAWRQDLERLVCVLAPVSQDQERWIQPEPVVDHPEIVLHIWSPPRQAPQLVEVEFPAGTLIEEAKAFVLRELDELPLQTRARGLRWDETAEHVVVHFGGELPGKSRRVTLGDGVFEVVHLLAGHWQTARLEFEHATWTRERAIAWVQMRLGLAGHERTLLLDRPRRACPALAGWLADLFDEGFRSPTAPTPCVEFITVPSLSDDRPGRRHEPASRNGVGVATLAPKLKALRGGAGIEINLAEPRRHDLLPRELRDVLPGEGLVNYLEAQACVRLVRELLDNPATRKEIEDWQHANGQTCKTPPEPCPPQAHRDRTPGIAILALYPAQARLIRYLLETVPLGSIQVEVAVPEQMRHRECAVAIVSLTRSHQHRAVTYGDNPAQLVLALTRPAQRLILIGDPGTLLRRSQFCEPVDQLDDAESEQEQALTSRLVRYLQGHGAQQRAFTIRELAGL